MDLICRNYSPTEKFVWTIMNFNRTTSREGIPFKSAIIHKGHARKVWRFFLYPSSIRKRNFVGVFFFKAYKIFDPVIYKCSLSIECLSGNEIKSHEFPSIDFSTFGIGADDCIRRDSMEKLRKGSITIKCEITELYLKSFFLSAADDFENLSLDLTVLYNYPIHSDLTVRIQQSKFALHTCVLYARARRLCDFFGYQSYNEMPKIIEINNISSSLFRQLMLYIYSGKSNVSKELFMCAHELQLQSLKQKVHGNTQEHRTHTEIAIQNLEISWNLSQIKFHQKGTVPFVQIFRAMCCASHLAVRVGISEDCDGENCVDISFKIFLDCLYKSVSLVCVMTLIKCNGIHTYKKDSCNIKPGEEWHFPPFFKVSDIPENPYCYLVAEVSLSDGCTAYNNLHTTTRLVTQTDPFIYPERLGSDMSRLLSPNVESRFKKHDLYLKSTDNGYVPAHKAILFARWPAIRWQILRINELYSIVILNLRREEIELLLEFIYTGSLKSFDHSTAEKLLQINSKMECPPYLVKKCQNFLNGRTE